MSLTSQAVIQLGGKQPKHPNFPQNACPPLVTISISKNGFRIRHSTIYLKPVKLPHLEDYSDTTLVKQEYFTDIRYIKIYMKGIMKGCFEIRFLTKALQSQERARRHIHF